MISFVVNEVYYRVTYTDPKFLYPLVDTFVYVGKNLSGTDDEDTWYFQFAYDYGRFGSVLETNSHDSKVSCLLQNELEGMLDFPSLIKELETSNKRREKKK